MPAHFKSRSGQSLVEFALILPFLLLIILGTFDLGRAVYSQTVISNAAREGARYGIIPGRTTDQIKDAAIATAIGVTLERSHIAVAINGGAETITVNISYPLAPLTPMIGVFFGPSGNLTLTSSATMKTE